MSDSLVFPFGSPEPLKGLRLVAHPRPTYGPDQVLVQFLAVPINPLDFLVIHGKYPIKPQSSIVDAGETLAIPGSDGAARVVEVGSGIQHLAVGDLVVLRTHCKGTWRTHAVLGEDDLIRLPSTLREYCSLEPGDWIMQNAATGTISHFVSQFAPLYGVGVISVIRNRANANELERTKRSLRSHGASLVLTEEELHSTNALDGKRVVLAIDSISDDDLARHMATRLTPGGTLSDGWISPSEGIFRGAGPQQEALFEWFAKLLAQGTLKAPALEYVGWKRGTPSLEETLREAIRRAHEGAVGSRKQIFVFE
ncbi:hypothetical protein N7468_010814 [Penicillium chermesinum]|uniref:enoyl-[acyl-carrier-protein] reductase n=1 Tax=Penicillium chermesinum TaxID=63820 RepID=A0A9W9TB41_9EURO|nr:uncharacterized protein N7468_010814 [Penicillium chermesinum]KAJ5215135.1 hypothetical protein N7468_010814 [Penicillium chermesinum]